MSMRLECTPSRHQRGRSVPARATGASTGEPLLPLLPPEARIDVELFIAGGRAILRAIRDADYDVLSRRPEVSKVQKAKLLAKAVLDRFLR